MKRAARWLWLLLGLAVVGGGVAVAAAEGVVKARERVLLRTSAGDVVLAFYPDVAPRHVAQVLGLVRLGAYDTVHVTRIDRSGHYVQLGDVSERELPLTAEQRAANQPLAAEFSERRHVRGAISMARDLAVRDSARSSMVFLLRDAPHLDPPGGPYSIIGEVERGLEVLDGLVRLGGRADNRPVVPVVVWQAQVVEAERLAGLALRGAVAMPWEPKDGGAEKPAGRRPGVPPAEERQRVAVVGLAAVALFGLAAFVMARRQAAGRWAMSLPLLVVLTAVFTLLALSIPWVWSRAWVGGVLVVVGLAAIKLMTFFDAER